MLLLVLSMGLSSCFKEKPLNPPPPGGSDILTNIIPMGSNYSNQFFFSLSENRVVAQNDRLVYDLMFECNSGSFQVWLNTAKFMSAIRTGKTDFAQVTPADTMSGNWLYELGEFNPDSSALGKWGDFSTSQPVSYGQVYIINRGVDNALNSLGFVKMKLNDFNGSSYSVSFQNFDETTEQTFIVTKDPSRNYKYFSFGPTAGVVDGIEPDKSTWDFCFTRYSVVFYDPYYLPYEVTGVLHNPSRIQAYLDSTYTFSDVKLTDFDVTRTLTRRDAIGYEWKRYELGDYTTKTWYTYFVQAGDDKFYKLRFLDFKKQGERGYPTFEYSQLF